jgi:uncharacterized membrane protein YphA (DoxX/SURF4 family)
LRAPWAKEVSLNNGKIQIGIATVILLIALRVALGWHFLYEGVWKIKHPDEFRAEAEGFLTGARGPMAGVFYAMVPDIDGRQRLSGEYQTVEKEVEEFVKDAKGVYVKVSKDSDELKKKKAKKNVAVVINEGRTKEWDAIRARFTAKHSNLEDAAQEVYERHLDGVQEYLGENWKDIEAYFGSLDRFKESKASSPGTSYQNKRNWDDMKKLRGEAKVWLAELDSREKAYKTELRDLLPKEDRDRDPFARGINILAWPRMEQISFAITWGLTALGVCLMLGLCTRPAALGGAVFMLFVVMSQPSYPGVVPSDPPQLGHALLVNKDFVEMIALFLVATTAVGRWAGLDYFLDNFVINPFLSKTVFRKKQEG